MAVKQRKKKNKFLPMLVLCGILAVLVIGTSVLSAANEKKAAEEAAELAASQNTSIMLAEYDAAKTVSISYSRGGEDFLTFRAVNGAWVYEGDPEFPVNQQTVGYMASALSSMAALRAVDEVDREAYGLDNPAFVIRVSYQDGVSHEYVIGNYNTFSGGYYFTMDGDCYMIASGLLPYFDYALNDLLALDTVPAAEWADIGYVTSVTVTKDGAANTITDEAGMTAVLEKLGALSLTVCADYHADDSEKAAYGIDGTDSISVKYKKAVTSTNEAGAQNTSYLETTYTFDFGAGVGGPAKSSMVYQFDEAVIGELLAYAEYVPAQ